MHHEHLTHKQLAWLAKHRVTIKFKVKKRGGIKITAQCCKQFGHARLSNHISKHDDLINGVEQLITTLKFFKE